jgi:nicotinate-nucleotide pyrophosphorylase (carboxylating)
VDRLKKEKVLPLIKKALTEDIGKIDLTSENIIPEKHISSGVIKTKEKAVLSGLPIVKWTFGELGDVKTEILVKEGIWLKPQEIIRIRGNTRAILKGERVALNFIQRLSGVSTYTRKFVDEIKGSRASILDPKPPPH